MLFGVNKQTEQRGLSEEEITWVDDGHAAKQARNVQPLIEAHRDFCVEK